ncbi:Conserved hypothetical protein [Candidatus Hamiltonella defensa (Bemisia tabaci)]|nr:Conserved hypothetical protein [Candidatus Hamiltonella defensa (Bemisia tabaci)]
MIFKNLHYSNGVKAWRGISPEITDRTATRGGAAAIKVAINKMGEAKVQLILMICCVS